jgi:ElaB/YqjD/DUF883 family membrane-anchored ribosome-binding protein
MNFDVNRIIMESLAEKPEIVIEESIEASLQAAKKTVQKVNDTFTGGSAEDEASASREFAKLAREKAIKEGLPVEEFSGKKIIRIDSPASEIKKAMEERPTEKTTSADEKQEVAQSIGKKALGAVQEHPGITAGVAAAIAAGLGALALRKRLKNAKKSKQ